MWKVDFQVKLSWKVFFSILFFLQNVFKFYYLYTLYLLKNVFYLLVLLETFSVFCVLLMEIQLRIKTSSLIATSISLIFVQFSVENRIMLHPSITNQISIKLERIKEENMFSHQIESYWSTSAVCALAFKVQLLESSEWTVIEIKVGSNVLFQCWSGN